MKLWLTKTLLKLLGRLPLPVNHWIGAQLGNLAWLLHSSARAQAEFNLALCLPELTPQARQKIARASLRESGKALTETGWIWMRPIDEVMALPHSFHNTEAMEAIRRNRGDGGLLVVTPHLGSWEFSGMQFARERLPMTLYRPPRQAWMEPLMRDARKNGGSELVPLSMSGIRQLLKALQQGRSIGLLPDQEPDLDNGVFAPFFGIPANTMTLLSKLARRSGTQIILQFAIRGPNGAGYDIHYQAMPEDIADKDPERAATALNQALEECIRRFPEQYLWSYRRFRLMPDGKRRHYR